MYLRRNTFADMFLFRMKRASVRLFLQIVSNQAVFFCVSFIFGAILGLIFSLWLDGSIKTPTKDGTLEKKRFLYQNWLYRQYSLISESLDPDWIRYNYTKEHFKDENLKKNKKGNESEYITEADFLAKLVNVLCISFVTTVESGHAIKNTWGQHCNQLFLVSHILRNDSIPIMKIKSKSSFNLLCESLRESLKFKNWTWVLVVREDTVVVVENLRYYLAPFNYRENYYMGHSMKFWGQYYNWGQAGYALSRSAVEKFSEKFNTSRLCVSGGKYWKQEDWYLGKHLADLSINTVDTRDHLGKSRFNGFTFKKLIFPGAISMFDRFWRDSTFAPYTGPSACSNYAITFHGIVSKSKMYQIEYILYHLRVFPTGGIHGNKPHPKEKAPPSLTWDEHLKEEKMGFGLANKYNQFVAKPEDLAAILKKEFKQL